MTKPSAYAKPVAYQWLSTVLTVQAIIVSIAFLGHYSLGTAYSSSPFGLYALLNLALAMGLSFALTFSGKLGFTLRAALICVSLCFGLLLLVQFNPDTPASDRWSFVSWAASATALSIILFRADLPIVARLALVFAVAAQGIAAIADVSDGGQHGPNAPLIAWFHIIGLALSMGAYQVGFQYLVQATMDSGAGALDRSAGGRRISDVYTLWKHFLPKSLKRRLMVAWYNLVARVDAGGELLFMNHGYEPPDGDSGNPSIPSHLEHLRYPIQLYDLLASKVDWRRKDGLEVSSGLGGGTLWVHQAYQPKSLTGLDIAERSVRNCNDRYGHLGLSFKAGDAQAMPFPDASFDIIINVESSLNYPDMTLFLAEVDRVLKPGGYFLFADYRRQTKMPRLRALLVGMSFEVVELQDITPGIIRGIEQEETRKAELISRRMPGVLKTAALHFAGLGKGERNERDQFNGGEKEYIAAVLRKPSPRIPA